MHATGRPSDPSRASHRLSIAAIAGALFLVAACGSGSAVQPSVASLASAPPAGDGAAPTVRPTLGAEDREQALLDYAGCMRDNGVEMADPQFDQDGRANLGTILGELDQNDPTFKAASVACNSLLPSSQANDPVLQAEQQARLIEFAACMRDNGVEMADPVAGGGPGHGAMAGLDQNDPTVQAGLEACRPLLGQPGGGQ